MFNLYTLTENSTSGLVHNLLNIIVLVSILCGVFVITSKNPIVSVLFLIGLFLTIASYLMILGISFIGLSYLLVYVGAVSILFLFILMLINVRVSELTTDNTNSMPLAIIIGFLFNIVFYNALPSNISITKYLIKDNLQEYSTYSMKESITNKEFTMNDNVYYASSHMWDNVLAETSHITSIGNVIYTSYPLLLIITSIILLLAMVGAIIITIKQ